MALPIRRLPILVIELILQTMGFIDLFLLTRTSTKMKRIVQNMNRTQKHHLFVIIPEPFLIQIQPRTDSNYAELILVDLEQYKPHRSLIFNMAIGSVDQLPSEFSTDDDGGLNTFWTDTKAGCIAFCNELVEVFRTPVRGVILELDDVENYQNEINWVNSIFPGLIMFEIRGECSFQDYMWMIKNARATEALKFKMEPTDYPGNTENLEVVPLDLEDLKFVVIDHGKWINLQQLQSIKSDYIIIKDILLTDSEFNEFLINLKSSTEKIKFNELDIYFVEEADPIVVLEGLLSEEEGASTLEDIFDGFVFKTENGQKCTIIFIILDEPDVEMFGFEIKIED